MGNQPRCAYQPKKRCVNLLAAPLCHIHVFRPISSCIATVPRASCICLTSSHFFFKSSSSFILIVHNSLRLRKKKKQSKNQTPHVLIIRVSICLMCAQSIVPAHLRKLPSSHQGGKTPRPAHVPYYLSFDPLFPF